jgi:osmotically-inducible protein OsmY
MTDKSLEQCVRSATDGTVILSGSVHSWAERREAERAAWAAPGVMHVDDRLTVSR